MRDLYNTGKVQLPDPTKESDTWQRPVKDSVPHVPTRLSNTQTPYCEKERNATHERR
jgi:hypothetical protein